MPSNAHADQFAQTMSKESWVGGVRRRAGLDFHVLLTLLFRSWSIVAGGLTVMLVPSLLGKVEQGYYYTFASLLALQIFFELGFNQVLMQVVGHEAAHLRPEADGILRGDARHVGRLASVVALLHRWYAVAALLYLVAVGTAGSVFFARSGELPASGWAGVWWLLVACTATNLYLSPLLAVLEGCGQIGQVARLRLVQSLIGYLLLWAGLALGFGLWAVALLPAATAVCTIVWLRLAGATLRWLRTQQPADRSLRIDWRREILPFQWRIAVSWISGYFIFQLFTPLVFARQGAVQAGRIGLALSVFSALLTVGMSWVNAKIPAFAAHISRGERLELNALFISVLKRSVGFTALASLAVLVGVFAMARLGLPGVNRIAGLPVLGCLALVSVANSIVFAAAAYMRAHKEEPMLLQSVGVGVLVLAGAWLGSMHGTLAIMSIYAAVSLLVSLPWTLHLFMRYFGRAA